MATSRYMPNECLMSAPIPVYFMGWESNTALLQRHGWEFRVSEEPYNFSYRFALINQHIRLGGISEMWDGRQYFDEALKCLEMQAFDMKPGAIIQEHRSVPPINFTSVVHSDKMVFRYDNIRPESFISIDMEPRFEQFEEFSLSKFFPFNKKAPPTVILEDKADLEVVDHLQKILDSQQDKQREIREKQRTTTFRQQFKVIA